MYLDPNGIAVIEESDPIVPFQVLINGMQAATSNKIAEVESEAPQIRTGTVAINYNGSPQANRSVSFSPPFTGSGTPVVMATPSESFTSPRTIAHAFSASNTGATIGIMTADGSSHGGTREVAWVAIKV